MNAKAEKIAFKDVHRFPSWPPCIRPFLKGLSWKIKCLFFPLFRMDPQSRNRCDTSNLYFVHTSEKNDTDQSRGSGSRPERRTIGVQASNDRAHLSSLLCTRAGSAGGEKGLCLCVTSTNEGFSKGCHVPELSVLPFPHVTIPTLLQLTTSKCMEDVIKHNVCGLGPDSDTLSQTSDSATY